MPLQTQALGAAPVAVHANRTHFWRVRSCRSCISLYRRHCGTVKFSVSNTCREHAPAPITRLSPAGSRCVSSLASPTVVSEAPWAFPAFAAVLGITAHWRWQKKQQAFVESGACAAAASLLGAFADSADSASHSQLKSTLYESSGESTEYVYLQNRADSAANIASATAATATPAVPENAGDMLLFFHGGLCGSDQLLASGLRFPPSIQHLLLINRQGYLRSCVPTLWEAFQQQQPYRRKRVASSAEGATCVTAEDRARLCRNRLWHQAALFNNVVSRVLQLQKEQQLSTAAELQKSEVGLHLLGVGVGCAHAIAFGHFFPRKVRSISLVEPVLQLQAKTAGGPLEAHVLNRVAVYRRLLERLPKGSVRVPVPPPKISGLEWIASGAARLTPGAALAVLLQAMASKPCQVPPSLQQLLEAGEQQPPLLQQLLCNPRVLTNFPGGANSEIPEHVQQQRQTLKEKQELYRQLLLRVQHVSGSCFLAARLPGFIEDCLLLAPWHGEAPEASIAGWLFECLARLQVPRLIVLAGKGSSSNSELERYRSLSGDSTAPVEAVDLPEAHPQTLLLTHATQLNVLLRRFQSRTVSTASSAG
ncbi:hypothetical protein, conserved [Eimeria necatrix]|uniref:Uncharacterized protein n=1 Tax=Eimeria necatrix TaxID=51315 RepID=U6ME66_9EIME|nr:hypothetical protein, conserved [Eimeria necatrix]CDJ62311.1 hypothetical protein, conserved [Eimeria necatrix]